LAVISLSCNRGEAEPPAPHMAVPRVTTKAPPPSPETTLGVTDKGIWSDLDGSIQIVLPARLDPVRVTASIDTKHQLLVLSIDGFPRKVYPLGGGAVLDVGDHHLALRRGDRAELQPLLAADRVRDGAAAHDHDGDGIPDPLDILIGAKKTVA